MKLEDTKAQIHSQVQAHEHELHSGRQEEDVEDYSLPTSVDSSIPESRLSMADISKKHSHPVRSIVYLLLVLLAIVLPYWLGRTLAVSYTAQVVEHYERLSPYGVLFLAWMVTVGAFTGLAMVVLDAHRWFWRVFFIIFLVLEQFVAGLCLLRMSFWYATYVVYGSASGLANAANLGILAAGFAVAVFAVLFVGLLVTIPKTSKLNVLTRSWACFIMFFVIEVIALLVVMFGGLLTAM